MLFFSLMLSNYSFSQTSLQCNCKEDLTFVYNNLLKSISYKKQKKEVGETLEKAYQGLSASLEGKRVSTHDCFVQLHKLLDLVKDNHNALRGNSESFSLKEAMDSTFLEKFIKTATYSLHPTPSPGLEKLERELADKPSDQLEGIYSFKDFFTIGIYKAKNENIYKQFYLGFTNMSFHHFLEYERVGIPPDTYLSLHSSWIEQAIKVGGRKLEPQ